MDSHRMCSYYLIHLIFLSIHADLGPILTIDVHQDERIRLECTLTSKSDAEEAMWMRIRSPHDPDVLTYRDNVVYAPDRYSLEQRRLSSSVMSNGTFLDTYFSILTIARPTVTDEGRYVCFRGRQYFAEYDLFIIIPPYFNDHHPYVQHQTVVEGSTLRLSCSVSGRPQPFIAWFYRTSTGRHVSLSNDQNCFDQVCEIHLANYTRHDPSMIECVADNGKSARISRIFHISVIYPPKIQTSVRALTGSQTIEIFLECSSNANPLASITWLDDNEREINDQDFYTIEHHNQTSVLSFIVHPSSHSKVLYFCRSNNSLGTVEKLINISEFLRFETKTTISTSQTSSTLKQTKSSKTRSRLRTTTPTTPTTTPSSCSLLFSIDFFWIFIFAQCLQ